MTVAIRHIMKDDWPTGEWTDEHDLEVWTDDATGYRCLIVRANQGHLCGYVEVPENHPWNSLSYRDHPDGIEVADDDWFAPRIYGSIDVHGGLTFSGDRTQVVGSGWWFGFDCAHLYDLSPTMLRDGYHSTSASTYRDLGYVRRECASLARQLAEVAA